MLPKMKPEALGTANINANESFFALPFLLRRDDLHAKTKERHA